MTLLNVPGTIAIPTPQPAVRDMPTAVRLLTLGFWGTK
jgi:hypothetical protein